MLFAPVGHGCLVALAACLVLGGLRCFGYVLMLWFSGFLVFGYCLCVLVATNLVRCWFGGFCCVRLI